MYDSLCMNLIRHFSLKSKIKCATALAQTVSLIVHPEFENLIEMNKLAIFCTILEIDEFIANL